MEACHRTAILSESHGLDFADPRRRHPLGRPMVHPEPSPSASGYRYMLPRDYVRPVFPRRSKAFPQVLKTGAESQHLREVRPTP
jgi:hypothetical protein